MTPFDLGSGSSGFFPTPLLPFLFLLYCLRYEQHNLLPEPAVLTVSKHINYLSEKKYRLTKRNDLAFDFG